jgi:hypothetical protein
VSFTSGRWWEIPLHSDGTWQAAGPPGEDERCRDDALIPEPFRGRNFCADA